MASVAGVGLLAAGFFFGARASRREPPRFQRITFRHGLVTNARFTDDPHNVVYSASWDGSSGRVFLATPGNPESRDLDLPEGSTLASVSSKNELAILTGRTRRTAQAPCCASPSSADKCARGWKVSGGRSGRRTVPL
jgi:hypothetical protein